jgi:hypothetical protein
MAASGVADIAVGFEWTAFAHGFVYWEYPGPEHLPPAEEAGQREWLAGFRQAHADYPDDPCEWVDPDAGESPAQSLARLLAGDPDLPELLALLDRMRVECQRMRVAGGAHLA